MSPSTCPNCGSELTPEGGCPRCLLGLGLEAGDPEGPTLPAQESEAPTLAHDESDPGPVLADRIGPYRLLEILGEGGMGTVYLAEQREPIERRVAVKVVKAGMDTAEVVARFESERQALALMSHPNIAKVLDAGATGGGRPYFVMEYVHGVPITRYCDDRRLGARERLALLLPVCRGVQHAHQKGIIHRDLKPSNVLVAIEDGKPQPQIIDFGVAKATQQRLTEKTLFTQRGLIVGTPEYMSPEQADAGALDIDTTTDVYSLGVLLYELLTGVLPFDSKHLREAGYREMQRIIQEEEPVKPSTRVGHLGDTATDVAACRNIDSPSLVKRLRGDLDWITLRCLEKDRTRRYQSASELAADLQRHLENEPVAASPPSAVYRIRKMVARHRMGVAFAASMVMLLIALAATMTVQSARVARQRDRAVEAEKQARTEAETAEQVTDFLIEIFDVSDPTASLGQSIKAREILDRGAERIDERLQEQPEVGARLRETLGRVYGALGLLAEGRPMLESALEEQEAISGEVSLEAAGTLHVLAELLESQQELEAAEEYARRALAIRRDLLGDAAPATAESLSMLGVILSWTREGASESRMLLEEALAVRRVMIPGDDTAVAESLFGLGVLLSWNLEDFEAGEPLLTEALAIRRRVLPRVHPGTIWSLQALGNHFLRKGDPEQAEPLLREAIDLERALWGNEHWLLGGTLNELAGVERLRGRFEEAALLLDEAVEIVRASQGEGGQYYGLVQNLASCHVSAGQYREAEDRYRELIAVDRESEEASLGRNLEDLAHVLVAGGRLEEAEACLREARDSRLRLEDPIDPRLASVQFHLAQLLRRTGRSQEASAVCKEVVRAHSDVLRDPPAASSTRSLRWIQEGHSAVASCLIELGRYHEAEPILVNSLPGLESAWGIGSFRVQRVLRQVVRMYERLGDDESAARYRADLVPGWQERSREEGP